VTRRRSQSSRTSNLGLVDEQQGEISGLSRSVSNLGSSLGAAVAGTILVAELVTWSYGLAMVSLAIIGVIGLIAALFLPANPVPEGVGGTPGEVR
jgi:predicted MFS family arabinose efflux permease